MMKTLFCSWSSVIALFLFAVAAPSRGAEPAAASSPSIPTVPYPTGSHLQLVRRFFTAADGLPGDEIRSVAAARDGTALAATANGVALLEGERWVKQAGLAEVSALFAPVQG